MQISLGSPGSCVWSALHVQSGETRRNASVGRQRLSSSSAEGDPGGKLRRVAPRCRVLADLTANPALAGNSYTTTPATVTTSTGRYVARYVFNGGVNPFIESRGYDRGDTQRTITQRVTYIPGQPPALANSVRDAVTALGDVSLSGSASLGSIRSGGTISVSGGAKVGASYSNDSQFRVNMTDSAGTVLYNSSGVPLRRLMTSAEYFDYYLGSDLCPVAHAAGRPTSCKAEAKATILARRDGYVCASNCNNASLETQYAAGKRIMWLEEGGMQINANVILGTVADPVTILVMNGGSVKINGTSKIYGLVFVDLPSTTRTATCACTATMTLLSNKSSWSAIQYTLTPNVTQIEACSNSVCQNAITRCVPSNATNGKKEGYASTCNYATDLLVGSAAEPIQIEVLGTWDNTGGGNSLIEGAALAAGHFVTNGNIDISFNRDVLNNLPRRPASAVRQVSGWSDMN